jgi:putative membrane protein
VGIVAVRKLRRRAPRLLPLFLLLAGLGCCAGAHAHDVEAELALGPALGWGAEWWALALLALSLLLYGAGMRRLWPRAHGARATLLRQGAWFGAGWLTLVLALASPLDAAGSYAFAAHMVQHELLMIVAAPLLVLGRPLAIWLWAFGPAGRRRLAGATRNGAVRAAWGALTRPLNAWLLHFAALWMWHVPATFQAALADNATHALQHTSFLGTALLFWWAVLGREGANQGRGAAIVYLFTTMMHTGALGALFTLSDGVWYPLYGNRAQLFGLNPLEDQQLGGLIMWIPGGLAYLAAGLVLCLRWLRQGGAVAGVQQ